MSAEQMKALAADLNRRREGSWGLGLERGYKALDAYYTGTQPLGFMSPDVRQQVGDRLPPLSINWARVIVGAIEERLDVQGFRGVPDSAVEDIWATWQGNNLDESSQLGHADALVHGRAFGIAWADEEAPEEPRLTVESASQMTCSYKPGTSKLTAAAKIYPDPDYDGDASNPVRPLIGWLYLPDSVQKYRGKGSIAGGSMATWDLLDTLPNPLGVVPVVPLVNRPNLVDLAGESELTDVLPILDAVNKLATDMMVSSEFHAGPRRYATNMEMPREARANQALRAQIRQEWDEALKGRIMIGGKDVQFGQLTEASLDNFISAIKLLVSQIAAIAGLPPHYLGINTENPASADAIRSAESSLVKKALRKQTGFGGSWEQLMRLAVCIQQGIPLEKLDPVYDNLETWWVDPNTPTPGAKADAALKLLSGDQPIITVNQAREDLGYSPQQIAAMNAETQQAQDAAATSDVRARVALAQELMTSQGLDQPAAYAAVGLLAAASQMSGAVPTTTPPPPPSQGSPAGGQAPPR